MESTLIEVKDMKTALLPNSNTNTNLTDIVETLEIGINKLISNIDEINETKSTNHENLKNATIENSDKLSSQKSPDQVSTVLTNNLVNIPSNNEIEEKNNQEIDENKLKEMCQSFNPDAVSVEIKK
jgi:hypothetical protein